MQLNLRTFASSGLIFYMAHEKQVDYAALQLQAGKLYFSFDLGKGRATATHRAIVSDGRWHTVGAAGDPSLTFPHRFSPCYVSSSILSYFKSFNCLDVRLPFLFFTHYTTAFASAHPCCALRYPKAIIGCKKV